MYNKVMFQMCRGCGVKDYCVNGLCSLCSEEAPYKVPNKKKKENVPQDL